MNFTAIDFETANGFRGSACAIGAAKIRDGQLVATHYSLLQPPAGFDRFDPRNVAIHGITPDDVTSAPAFAEHFDDLAAFIGDDVMVAHNAGFDMGVIESGLEVSNRPIPHMEFACTLTLSRKNYRLASHALPSAAAEAGYVLRNHHNALEDAKAAAAIVVDVANRVAAESFDALLDASGMQRRVLESREVGSYLSRPTRHAMTMPGVFDAKNGAVSADQLPDLIRWPNEGTNPPANDNADPKHPLYGQRVVFTGMMGLSRQDAKNKAAAHGAHTQSRIGASTTMLVIGDGIRPEELDDIEHHPRLQQRKMRDVVERRRQGQNIVLVTEPEFLSMLNENWPHATLL
jgi:DNA polymerase-3 subunit epsilon